MKPREARPKTLAWPLLGTTCSLPGPHLRLSRASLRFFGLSWLDFSKKRWIANMLKEVSGFVGEVGLSKSALPDSLKVVCLHSLKPNVKFQWNLFGRWFGLEPILTLVVAFELHHHNEFLGQSCYVCVMVILGASGCLWKHACLLVHV